MRQGLGTDAVTVVLYLKDGRIGIRGEAGLNFGVGRAVLDGVKQQVREEHAAVLIRNRNVAGSGHSFRDLDLNTAQGGEGLQLGNGMAQALGQIGDRLRAGAGSSALCAGQGQHIGHNLFQAE